MPVTHHSRPGRRSTPVVPVASHLFQEGGTRQPPGHESCLDPVLYFGSCVVLWAFRSALTFLVSRVLAKNLSAAAMSAL
jgi:hypothetical protein